MGCVLMARQVVFNRKSQVWGYELLFRPPESSKSSKETPYDGRRATASIIADGLEMALPLLQGNERALINVPEEHLLDGTVELVPSDRCVVEILETSSPRPALLRRLSQLKQSGYTLALDDYAGQEALSPFLSVVDLVKIDALATSLQGVPSLLHRLRCRHPKLKLLGEKIEDEETYHCFYQHGCDLFQGFFFRTPELLQSRAISSSTLTPLRLTVLLCCDDYSVEQVSDIIRSDACLSYKLLRYVNCVAHGLAARVESVEQAIVILGRKNILHWLTVVFHSVFSCTGYSAYLTRISTVNALFLASLYSLAPHNQPKENTLYLLGLFMYLDHLIQHPLASLLQRISLNEDINQALLARQGPLAPWLCFLEALYRGDWAEVDRLALQLELDPRHYPRMGELYLESCLQARHLMLPTERSMEVK